MRKPGLLFHVKQSYYLIIVMMRTPTIYVNAFFLLNPCQSKGFCNKVVIIVIGMGANAAILRFFRADFTGFTIVPDLTLLCLVELVDRCDITKFDR